MKNSFRKILAETKLEYEYDVYTCDNKGFDAFSVSGSQLISLRVYKFDFVNSEMMNSQKEFPEYIGRNLYHYKISLGFPADPRLVKFELANIFNISQDEINVVALFDDYKKVEEEPKETDPKKMVGTGRITALMAELKKEPEKQYEYKLDDDDDYTVKTSVKESTWAVKVLDTDTSENWVQKVKAENDIQARNVAIQNISTQQGISVDRLFAENPTMA